MKRGTRRPYHGRRWWWLEPGHEHARCSVVIPGEGQPGGRRCRGLAAVDGLCRVHARLAGKLVPCTCRRCGGEHEVAAP